MICVQPHHWLQNGCRDLRRERDQPDLPEVEVIGILQDRINRRHYRLQHVVQKMAKADRGQDSESGARRPLPGRGGYRAGLC